MAGAQLQALLWPRGSYESCYGLGRCCGAAAGHGTTISAAMAGALLRELLRLGRCCGRCRGPWHCNKYCYGRSAAAGDATARSVPTRAATPWGAAAGAAAGHDTAISAAMAGAQLRALLWPARSCGGCYSPERSYESCYTLGRCCGRCRGPWHCYKCCHGRRAAAGAAMARGVPTRAATLGRCRGPWRCFKCYYGRGAPVGRGAAASAMPGCCFLRCCGRDCESGVPVSAATAWGAG